MANLCLAITVLTLYFQCGAPLTETIVLLDTEKSWWTDDCRKLLAEHNVTPHSFPEGLGHLTDPCDSNQHSADRRRFARKVVSRNQSSPLSSDEKISFMLQAYLETGEDEIRSYFRRCGFFSKEDPRVIVSRLVTGWLDSTARNYYRYHKDQLEQYLWYRKLAGKPIIAPPDLIGPWWDTIRQF